MLKIKQTRFGGPEDPPEEQGDCWAACLASITEIPLGLFPVPATMEWGDHWDSVVEFIQGQGFGILRFPKKSEWIPKWPGHVIACGKSPNGDWDHCVVWKEGKIAWDPRPGTGLASAPHEYEVVIVL